MRREATRLALASLSPPIMYSYLLRFNLKPLETALRKFQNGSLFGDCSTFSYMRISIAQAELQQAKIKVQLKLSISRLRMVQQKDTAIAKQQRRAMAVLLEVIIHRLLYQHQANVGAELARQRGVSTHPCRKHHTIRHHHRVTRSPRIIL